MGLGLFVDADIYVVLVGNGYRIVHAAPYFRIFNPILQAQKFDKEGDFIHQWVPELANLPAPHCFQPWLAPQATLDNANVKLGDNYPNPIIDLTASRDRALNAYAHLKSKKT